MSIASGSTRRIAYVPEATFGVTPTTPSFDTFRATGGGPRTNKVTDTSEETGRSLASVLARDSQDPTTIVIGELTELQETYVARSAIPSDADRVQIEMVADDPRVWQLLDEQVIAPAPVNADNLAEPLIPQISVLHARCQRIETGIEVVWGVSTARGARNYEADLSYDSGATWEVLSPYGPASSGRAQIRQSDQPVTVRARAFGRTGLPGDYIATTFTTVAPLIDNSQVELRLPPIGYEGLTQNVRGRIENALGTAQGALARALESLDNDATNAAAIIAEQNTRVNADGALATRIDGVVAKTDENAAAVTSEIAARTTADSALATRIDAVVVQAGDALAAVTSEQTARINADGALGQRIDAVVVKADNALAGVSQEATARINADGALAGQITAVQAQTDRGTAFGRMTLNARSDIGGVQARFEVLLAAEVNGAVRGTGMMIDLLPNGSSAVRFDADKFYITAPGASGVPAFSFDAGTGTLRVPNLVLTSGQAASPLRIDIGSYTLIQGAGTVNDQVDANLNFTFTVTNDAFPSVVDIFGRLTVSGSNTLIIGPRILIDGEVVAFCQFNGKSDRYAGGTNPTARFRGQAIKYLTTGQHSVRIQYSYTSTDPNGKVQIEELKLSGFTLKA